MSGLPKSLLDDARSLELMKESLNDAQATVNAYDTIAQIVGVGYVFSVNVISGIGEAMTPSQDANILSILVAWFVVVLPIVFFGLVLYPTRRKARVLNAETDGRSSHILFFEPSPKASIEDLKSAVRNCDPLDEVAYELLKIANLREIKRRRFLRALYAAALAFLVLFASHLAALLGAT